MMSSDFQIDLDGGTTSSQIRTASDLSQQFSYLLGGISRVRAQVRSSTANVNHVNQIVNAPATLLNVDIARIDSNPNYTLRYASFTCEIHEGISG